MALIKAISKHLFTDTHSYVYVLVDGATTPNILASLTSLGVSYQCLQRGELTFEEAITSAYLFEVLPDSEALKWFLDGWNENRGIFIVSKIKIQLLREHLRKFLIVYDERGQPLKFRFYDPRVLRNFLKTCTEKQYQLLFGSIIERFAMKSVSATELSSFFSESSKQHTLLLTNSS